MTLRLPLRPFPLVELDGPRSREVVVTTVGVLARRPPERDEAVRHEVA